MDLLPTSSCRVSLCSPGYCVEYNLCSFYRETCGPGQWPSGIYLAGRAGSGARRPVFCTLLDAGGQSLILCGLEPRAPQKCPFSGPIWLQSHCHSTCLMRSSDTNWQLLGPVGTGMVGKRQRQSCLSAPPSASYFTFTLYSGCDLVSKSILRGGKGCQAGLKQSQQIYRGQGFGQPVGEGAWSWCQVGLGDTRRPYWY